MDDQLLNIILDKIKNLETKVDMLLSQYWKRNGISIAASFIFSIIFAIIIALIERH